MALVDDMAKCIREFEDAYFALNDNDDPERDDIVMNVIVQAHRNLRDLLERYDSGKF